MFNLKLQNDQGKTNTLELEKDIAEFNGKTHKVKIHDGDITKAGHISVNTLNIKAAYLDTIITRFENRNRKVDKYPGFTGFCLIKKDNTISVLTGWENREKFDEWVASTAYQEGHQQKQDRAEQQGSEYLVDRPIREHYSVIG